MTDISKFVATARRQLAPILDRSGNILYSSVETLRPGAIYLLGLNPGGDPRRLSWQTVRKTLDALPKQVKNEYLDVSWEGRPPGASKLQRRVRRLAEMLGLDLRAVCAANLIFVRSRDARSCGYPELAETVLARPPYDSRHSSAEIGRLFRQLSRVAVRLSSFDAGCERRGQVFLWTRQLAVPSVSLVAHACGWAATLEPVRHRQASRRRTPAPAAFWQGQGLEVCGFRSRPGQTGRRHGGRVAACRSPEQPGSFLLARFVQSTGSRHRYVTIRRGCMGPC